MWRGLRRKAAGAAIVACGIGGALTLASADAGRKAGAEKGTALALAPASGKAPAPSPALADLLRGFDPLSHRARGERLVSALPGGRRAVLTLHPGLQAHAAQVLARYEVPFGAIVAMEPRSGRVLAYVSHSSADPGSGDLARDAGPPAASVFKLVTTAALLDAGVTPASRVCYHGGAGGLVKRHLVDDPRRDTACASLADAVGRSINAVIGKLADRHLSRADLVRYAEAFGFGHALPFDVPTEASRRDIPRERLELARTAAGFWHTHMSPLHGALIAATIAADGVMPRPFVVDRVLDGEGKLLRRREPEAFRSVIARTTARTLARMMERTVTHGTARRAFFDAQGHAFLPGIRVAGKTGSLSSDPPYRGYTWWVGFAPADAPRIAVAALVVNSPRWRIKASYAARETLRYYLREAD